MHIRKNTYTEHIHSFARFWDSYPRKVGRKKAEQAWLKLKPDERLVAVVLGALEKQKQTDQWKRDSGKYIPYPATWLNGERWTDEVESDPSDLWNHPEPSDEEVLAALQGVST